jgi:hypothetical protein
LSIASNRPAAGKAKADFPTLAKGQLWKTEKGFVAIDHVGKRLIDYRLLKEPGQKNARSQTASIVNLASFLDAHVGRLVKGA